MPSFSLLKRVGREFSSFQSQQQQNRHVEQQQQPQQQQQQQDEQRRELRQEREVGQNGNTGGREGWNSVKLMQSISTGSSSAAVHDSDHGSGIGIGIGIGIGGSGSGSGSGTNGSRTVSPGRGPGRTVEERRRSPKRDLLALIGRTRLIGKRSTPLRGRAAGAAAGSQPPGPGGSTPQSGTSLAQVSALSSPGPRSPINPNKPLPSPPPPGSEAATAHPPSKPVKPVLRLERIMATLTDTEIEKLFSGAPQYFARSEGHFTGAPHPSVAFPWDEVLEIRDLTDHGQIEDRAWSCVTAWPHITRDVQPDRSTAQKMTAAKRRAHFYPRCRERPNMLSMSGLEKGSVGYQAALELGVSDALQEEQFGFEALGAHNNVIVEQRQRMVTSKDGLRHLDETGILEQLIKNGTRYMEQHLRERRVTSEWYNDLFSHILHPPTKLLDHNDPFSLSVQIQALVKVMAVSNMWIDFSHVEWRIKLGQLLWGTDDEIESGDSASVRTADSSAVELHEERYWLLLQILLASELLIRLDAITEGEELGVESIKPSEVHRFEKDANRSVKWSLHLARAWLENIEVVKAEKKKLQEQEKPSGWLATLTKRMSLANEHSSHQNNLRSRYSPDYVYAIRGRHCERQVHGLTHFARQLKWPGIDSYERRISENCRALTEGTPFDTPLSSPVSAGKESQRSSYFGGLRARTGEKPKTPSSPARRRKIQAALHPSGWLSKSYVSGLMLPGEALCHFLMATLLENDQEAMAKLGPMANLCGGFVYYGKSFWSTACIVGRVLAAGKGSAECMGWISSDITPQNMGDGWVNIEVDPVPEDAEHINRKARLWFKAQIEKESGVLGDADPSMVLPADFIIPFENIYKEQAPPTLWIDFKALALWAPVDSVHTTPMEEQNATPSSEATRPPEIHTYPAALTFEVARDDESEAKEYTFTLANDVYFVTAHPCVPSQHVKIMKSATSPTIQQVDLSGNGGSSKAASIIGHPLHKYYTYMPIHLSALLSQRTTPLDSLLSSYSSVPTMHRPSLTPSTTSSAKFLVIDCITNFSPLPLEHEIPLSPVASRSSSLQSDFPYSASPATPTAGGWFETAGKKMHHETRRRQFGSDMEVLVRAFCAERGWNAVVSRRRRGCLACAIREAGALGWKVVVRVD